MTLKSAYLVSDVHLDASRPELTNIFVRFLQCRARMKPALFLLGDIFEAWIGDDADAELESAIATQLRSVTRAGTAIYFMHGNRDFLLGQHYAERAGMTLIDDPYRISIGGIDTLLAHGDRYCIGDQQYQAFRRQSRDPQWQASVLAMPLVHRRAFAASLRAESMSEQKRKAEAGEPFTDVVDAPIILDLERYSTRRLIHGHTHRPDVHRLDMPDGRSTERIVLGDWHDGEGEVMEIHENGAIERHRLT